MNARRFRADAARAFFGGLLTAVGVLFVLLSGLCALSLALLNSIYPSDMQHPTGFLRLSNELWQMIGIGVAQLVAGLASFFYGRRLSRGDRR